MAVPPNLRTNHADNTSEIITAATINELAAAANVAGSQVFNASTYGSLAVADASVPIQAAIAAANAAGGGLVAIPPGSITTTTPVIQNGNVRIMGAGKGATQITYSGAGYAFDTSGAAVLNDMGISNMSIFTTSAATGAIRVGRRNLALSTTGLRHRYEDLFIQGPGSNFAGTVGMLLSNIAESRVDNIEIKQFEGSLLMDRTTVNLMSRVRAWYFSLYGIQYSGTAGFGGDGGGPETAIGLDIIGPDRNNVNGVCLKVDMGFVRVTDSFLEPFASGITSKAIVWCTANSGQFQEKNCFYSLVPGNSVTNTIVIDNATPPCLFYGNMSTPGAIPAASIGTIAAGNYKKHQFVDCEYDFINALALPLTTCSIKGPHLLSGVLGQRISDPIFMQRLISNANANTGYMPRQITALANLGVAQVANNAGAFSMIMISDSGSGKQAIFSLNGGGNLTVKMGGDALFTVTAATPASVNVYWSAGNARYEIENRTGSTSTFVVHEFMMQ